MFASFIVMLAVLIPGVALEDQPDLDHGSVIVGQHDDLLPALPFEVPELTYGVGEPWATLAECESGNWLDGGGFEEGSARWYWARPGTTVPPWGTTIHHGGLQFHPGTWDAFRLDGYPARAYDATPQQQVAVAERVLAAQGWGAWPTCARRMGLLP